MTCIKTYEYHYSEDEIKQMIVDYWNSKNTEHLPITKNNIKIDMEHKMYCEPEAKLIITIEEGV